ncbi:MAG: N(2)-fixation sustaining protein CowN [Thiohalocapsa sp.]
MSDSFQTVAPGIFEHRPCGYYPGSLSLGRVPSAISQHRTTRFRSYFAAKLDGTNGPSHDELYHIHCHLNDLRDLIDRWEETALGTLLENLESECC